MREVSSWISVKVQKGADKCCYLCVFSATIRRASLDETAFEIAIHENTVQEWLNTKPKTLNFYVSQRTCKTPHKN